MKRKKPNRKPRIAKINTGITLSPAAHKKLGQLANKREDRSASAVIESLIAAQNLGKLEFIK